MMMLMMMRMTNDSERRIVAGLVIELVKMDGR